MYHELIHRSHLFLTCPLNSLRGGPFVCLLVVAHLARSRSFVKPAQLKCSALCVQTIAEETEHEALSIETKNYNAYYNHASQIDG